jgi:hypothetical protein
MRIQRRLHATCWLCMLHMLFMCTKKCIWAAECCCWVLGLRKATSLWHMPSTLACSGVCFPPILTSIGQPGCIHHMRFWALCLVSVELLQS